jgi:pyruvate dehydrogenase E1 component alpha subunit
MGTSITRSSASHDLVSRGAPFEIPGHQVDGMNVVAVRQAAAEAFEHARSGKGPYILEMLTYRYRGHSMSDPAKYRSKDEVSRMRQEHDPIDQVRKRLIDGGLADENQLKTVDNEVKAQVTEAADFAQQSPEPDPSELWTDVYGEVGA